MAALKTRGMKLFCLEITLGGNSLPRLRMMCNGTNYIRTPQIFDIGIDDSDMSETIWVSDRASGNLRIEKDLTRLANKRHEIDVSSSFDAIYRCGKMYLTPIYAFIATKHTERKALIFVTVITCHYNYSLVLISNNNYTYNNNILILMS